ncbi:MAG TPA: F0F1 ATP synthase subunit B [Candidatus Dormibacteraeota bacterium]
MYLAEAGILNINATFWIEVAAFLLMLGILWRYVYPRVMEAAEARQKAIAAELEEAEKARQEAQKQLEDAQKQLDDARAQAQDVIAGASRSADQLREELRQKAEEDAKRLVERSRVEIVAERQKALDSVRREVAELVVEATERVIGESLDDARHKKLIDNAIKEVAAERG